MIDFIISHIREKYSNLIIHYNYNETWGEYTVKIRMETKIKCELNTIKWLHITIRDYALKYKPKEELINEIIYCIEKEL